MNLLPRLATYIAAFVLGVAVDLLAIGLYVRSTYTCTPSPTDPCDAGGMLGFSLLFLSWPFAGAVTVWLSHRFFVSQRGKSASS